MSSRLEAARAVADAVLYEGYLLYPYRSTSAKNQARWQFGVLGPPGAAAAGVGEEPGLRCQLPVRSEDAAGAAVTIRLRFLQHQARQLERYGSQGFSAVDALAVDGVSWVSWAEAVDVERVLGPFPLARLERSGAEILVEVPGGEEVEPLPDRAGTVAGRVVRRREPLRARVQACVETAAGHGLGLLTVEVVNAGVATTGRDDAAARSLVGAHLLLSASGAQFVSVIDPPDDARDLARSCSQSRCWPVLCGVEPAQQADVVLAAPIILYDHPQLAPQSAGDLFDATEIDEILTLRVLTMTDAEKAEARATDPRAAEIIDRCEAMSPQQLQRLHGVLRDPAAGVSTLTGDDWWAAEAAAPVTPETDEVTVAGVRLRGGSRVRLRPSRRADAQDIFLAGLEARVSAVHTDLDGATHVAVTLLNDPAAELHEWYGRRLYFAPDELEPLPDNLPDEPHKNEEER